MLTPRGGRLLQRLVGRRLSQGARRALARFLFRAWEKPPRETCFSPEHASLSLGDLSIRADGVREISLRAHANRQAMFDDHLDDLHPVRRWGAGGRVTPIHDGAFAFLQIGQGVVHRGKIGNLAVELDLPVLPNPDRCVRV
jgi:hypothetical protein